MDNNSEYEQAASDVRSTRSGKRNRQSQGPRSRGRRTRADTLTHETLQQQITPPYIPAAPSQTYPAPYLPPKRTQHAPGFEQTMNNPRSPPPAHIPKLQTPYRAAGNGNLSQTSLNPGNFSPISERELLPMTQTMPEQSMYNTRGAPHNLPISTASRVEGDHHSVSSVDAIRDLQQLLANQQVNTQPQPPVACSTFSTTSGKSTQDCRISDKEEKLLKLLRKKCMDVSNIKVIVKEDDYVVTYKEIHKSKDQPTAGPSTSRGS